jgi:ADP-heptose:LPS heptosyltransferase
MPFLNKINNDKVLLAGPWSGEFGWELFCWQGHIRWLSKQFDKTIIITRKGNEFLYEDFADDIFNVNAPSSQANMWLGKPNQKQLLQVLGNVRHTVHLKPTNIGFNPIPNNDFRASDRFLNQQTFVKYKSDTLDKSFDVILHPRNKEVGNIRNWTKEKFQKLVDLMVSDGLSVATIGTDEAFELNNVTDYRNIPIEDTVSLMNRTKLVVGQSSGPIHLASLCGTPHFVWSDESNRKRYKVYWNPHKTECHFYNNGGWNPKVNEMYDEIKRILS